jgi:hypothetical protein
MLSRVFTRTLATTAAASFSPKMSLFDITVKDANGADHPLSQYKGKVYVTHDAVMLLVPAINL